MKRENLIYIIIDNLKTLTYALIIAVFLRSLFFQPFYIPSSSMEPTLLVGDRLFVSKYTYGFSKHSFPFSPPIYNKRVFEKGATANWSEEIFEISAVETINLTVHRIKYLADEEIDGAFYRKQLQKTKIFTIFQNF